MHHHGTVFCSWYYLSWFSSKSPLGNGSSLKGASSLLFCIGGPYGHGRQLRERANISVKLSSLVLNHEIAVVVLIEQLYR
nr:putative RNA methyltransferase At5g10620 isoform X1 [Nicotiana tomentosiformis]